MQSFIELLVLQTNHYLVSDDIVPQVPTIASVGLLMKIRDDYLSHFLVFLFSHVELCSLTNDVSTKDKKVLEHTLDHVVVLQFFACQM